MILRTGADRLLVEETRNLSGGAYALLAHTASVTADLRPLHLALADSPAGPPTALFGPEHGYWAVEQDMVPSADARDPWTGVPVLSLYGDSKGSLRPTRQAFAGLDLLLIDLQDVGSRYYTYAATAVWAAEAALEAGLEVWILDRPNPLGGRIVEGNVRRDGYDSFVGAFPHPVRHGLTLGEIVLLEARRGGWARTPRILTMEGWRRAMTWPETGRPWIAPSPNMPTWATSVIYPGGCLIEATALSEGRGTTRPFHLVGAPEVDPPALAALLDARRIPGVSFLPTYFKPQFQKHAAAVCGGVEIVVTDPARFPAYRCGIELTAALHEHLGAAFAWRDAPYEFETDRPAIDLLTGDKVFRRALAKNDRPAIDAWIEAWPTEEAAFQESCRPILLYLA